MWCDQLWIDVIQEVITCFVILVLLRFTAIKKALVGFRTLFGHYLSELLERMG